MVVIKQLGNFGSITLALLVVIKQLGYFGSITSAMLVVIKPISQAQNKCKKDNEINDQTGKESTLVTMLIRHCHK